MVVGAIGRQRAVARVRVTTEATREVIFRVMMGRHLLARRAFYIENFNPCTTFVR